MQFKEKVKQIRKKSGLSQIDFANAVGIPVSTLNGIENNKMPTVYIATLIAKYAGMDVDDLIPCEDISYWEEVVAKPTLQFKKYFLTEQNYIKNKIKPGAKVLDIGCGGGRTIASFLERTPYAYGVDNDIRAINHVKRRFNNEKDAQFFHASAQSLPFKSNTFDLITLLTTLPNLGENKVRVLKEAKRVLAPDGLFIVSAYAETGLDDRLQMYKKVKAPIDRIEGTTVFFGDTPGADRSEQFSLEELTKIGIESGLKLSEHLKIEKLAYVVVYKKI